MAATKIEKCIGYLNHASPVIQESIYNLLYASATSDVRKLVEKGLNKQRVYVFFQMVWGPVFPMAMENFDTYLTSNPDHIIIMVGKMDDASHQFNIEDMKNAVNNFTKFKNSDRIEYVRMTPKEAEKSTFQLLDLKKLGMGGNHY